MIAGARRVRCRCKNADRHFGVCKCHRHKGDTVSELKLPLAPEPRVEDGNKFGVEVTDARTDVWWCAACDREWTVPSLPHNPNCPRCGTGGWFRRFV